MTTATRLFPTTPVSPTIRLSAGAVSDAGRNPNLPRNEDWVYFSHQPNDPVETSAQAQRGDLFIVCGSMGGRIGGQEASDIAGNMIRRQYYYVQPDALPVEQMLANALQEANLSVFKLSSQQGSRWFGMGTTVVAAVVKGSSLYVANVGDCRAYHISGNGIRQLTSDHTWVREALDAGRIDEATARRHPNRGALTRSLGNQPEVQPDISGPIRLSAGDAVVLCSDGLTDVVSDQEIGKLVRDNEPRAAAARLVVLANRHGGSDNVSVVVLKVASITPVRAAAPRSAGRASAAARGGFAAAVQSRAVLLAVAGAGAAIVAGASFLIWQIQGVPASLPAAPTPGLHSVTATAVPASRVLSATSTPAAVAAAGRTAVASGTQTAIVRTPVVAGARAIPVLLKPSTGETFTQRSSSIVLEWQEVPDLGPQDYYGVSVYLAEGEHFFPTPDTRYYLPASLYDVGPADRLYRWTVTVYRCENAGSACGKEGTPVSAAAIPWVFQWTDGSSGAVASPTVGVTASPAATRPPAATATPEAPTPTPRPPTPTKKPRR